MKVLCVLAPLLIVLLSVHAQDETTTAPTPVTSTAKVSLSMTAKQEPRVDVRDKDDAEWEDRKRRIEKEIIREENYKQKVRDEVKYDLKKKEAEQELAAIPLTPAAVAPAVPLPKSNLGTQGNGVQNAGFGIFGQQPLDAGSLMSSGMVNSMLAPPRQMGDASGSLIPPLMSPTMQQGINQQQSALGTNAAFPQYAQQAHPQYVQQPYAGMGGYNQMPASTQMGSMPMPMTSNNGQLMPGFAPSGNQMGFPTQQAAVYNPQMTGMQPQPMPMGNGMVPMNTGYGNSYVPNPQQPYTGFGG